MYDIILASKSSARKRLLKQIGFSFRVVGTNIAESMSLKHGVHNLVVVNAVNKARVAAKKCNDGVVIAADTVVLVKNKLLGKPKNLKDAQNAIALLSHTPHWVYSGLAVLEVKTAMIHTGWDRTKVYMIPLRDRQIREYCRKFKPFNKAGSFDIQGPGALLVRRIEGCFFNVVGIPMEKLSRILNEIGINSFHYGRS